MPNTPTDRLRLPKPADNDGNWGVPWRKQMDRLDEAIAGMTTIAMADADTTLTTHDEDTDQARHAIVKLTGTLTAQRNIVIPAKTKVYEIWNATTHGLQVKTAAGAGAIVPPAQRVMLFCDGTDCFFSNSGLFFGADLIVGANAAGAALPLQLVDVGRSYTVIGPNAGVMTMSAAAPYYWRVFDAVATPGVRYLISYSPGIFRTENVSAGQGGLGFRIGRTTLAAQRAGGASGSAAQPTSTTYFHTFGIPFSQQNPMAVTGGLSSYNSGGGGGFSFLALAGGFTSIVDVPAGERLVIVLSCESTTGTILGDHINSVDRWGIWKLTSI